MRLQTVTELYRYGNSVVAKCAFCRFWFGGCSKKMELAEVDFKDAPNDYWYRYIMECKHYEERQDYDWH